MMKQSLLLLLFSVLLIDSKAQNSTPYIDLNKDHSIEWASEYNTMMNLASKSVSLKKWYLQKIQPGTIKTKNEWLNNYSFQLTDDPKEWSIVNKSDPGNRMFISNKEFSNDSCCGCDGSEAFLVKQILYYRQGKLRINNDFISPLCARKENDNIKWYRLGNFASNNTYLIKSDNAKLLTTREIKYYIGNETDENSNNFTNITGGINNLINLILRDIEKGIVKVLDYNSGKNIPAHDLLKWRMAADTIIVHSANGNDKQMVSQSYRKSEDLSLLRLKEDLYFDFTNEKLFSVVRSAVLYDKIKSADGSVIGYRPLCRVVFK